VRGRIGTQAAVRREKTWPSSIRTSAVGTSSAHRPNVPPLARSTRPYGMIPDSLEDVWVATALG
jgi:hypothetical protein